MRANALTRGSLGPRAVLIEEGMSNIDRSQLPFSTPDKAARNIQELLEYLWRCHNTDFIYRGQTREYPLPLVPSAYRMTKPSALVTAPHISSLRSTGRKFFLVRQFKNDFQEICLWHFGQDEAPDRDEMGLLHSIVQSNLLARRIAAWGFQAAIRQTMKPTLVKRYKHASSSGRV